MKLDKVLEELLILDKALDKVLDEIVDEIVDEIDIDTVEKRYQQQG